MLLRGDALTPLPWGPSELEALTSSAPAADALPFHLNATRPSAHDVIARLL